jgi:hypothetical protein
MEVNLYEGLEFPFTAEWYSGRDHAPHAEQDIHKARMLAVAEKAVAVMDNYDLRSVVDLGAGDGGMLDLISKRALGFFHDYVPPSAFKYWGYDLQANNVDYARAARKVDVMLRDFIDEPIEWGDLAVITECLEHLQYPHQMVRRIFENAKVVIASSPASETAESHDACHVWVWDMEGYRLMFEAAGFTVIDHEMVTAGGYDFQVITATA